MRWVALPDAPIGYGGDAEVELIEERKPPYLRGPRRAGHWRVYEVTTPHPLVVPEGGADIRATALDTDEVRFDVRRPAARSCACTSRPTGVADGPGCVERAGRLDAGHRGATGPHPAGDHFCTEPRIDRGRRCSG